MSGTTMTTERILRWRRELRRVAGQQRAETRLAGSSPCQDSAACIIATTAQPELPFRTSYKEYVEKQREKRACRRLAVHFAQSPERFLAAERILLGYIRSFPNRLKLSNRVLFMPDRIVAKHSSYTGRFTSRSALPPGWSPFSNCRHTP